MQSRLWLLVCLCFASASPRANSHQSPAASLVDVILEEHGESLTQLRSRVMGYLIHFVRGRTAHEVQVELLPGEPISHATITLANQRDWTILSTVLGQRDLLLENGKIARFLSGRLFVVKTGNLLTLRDAKIAVRFEGKIRELSMAHFRRLVGRCAGSLVP